MGLQIGALRQQMPDVAVRMVAIYRRFADEPDRFVPCDGSTRIEPGDEVFALADDANLDAIELYIHRVRKKLENGVESGSPDGAVITTLRGIGYLLQPRSAMAPAASK